MWFISATISRVFAHRCDYVYATSLLNRPTPVSVADWKRALLPYKLLTCLIHAHAGNIICIASPIDNVCRYKHQWAGYSIGYMHRQIDMQSCLCLLYTSQMLNHKCCCYTYLLCAVVGFTLRLGRRGYIKSPRPRPLSSKCLIYYPPPLYSHPLYTFSTRPFLFAKGLSHIFIFVLFLCCWLLYIHSFFFFFFVVICRLVRVRTRGIFNHEFLHFFICAMRVKTMARAGDFDQ